MPHGIFYHLRQKKWPVIKVKKAGLLFCLTTFYLPWSCCNVTRFGLVTIKVVLLRNNAGFVNVVHGPNPAIGGLPDSGARRGECQAC
jgi:hypothetical protein